MKILIIKLELIQSWTAVIQFNSMMMIGNEIKPEHIYDDFCQVNRSIFVLSLLNTNHKNAQQGFD